ncbi:hypothetical protein FsymDg_3505 [Candidatus Protofrankia datiscae]|uniref:Uncharacterized protein n=1 Tax=Candidatus Protofrankia datiscae TaxID=2716812 RepID=F8B1M7_9ACTN|nr:hypothetical protein FsymDg_3505 [Candidatus Protofrankia datiscae]
MPGASLTLGFFFRICRVCSSTGWTGPIIGCGYVSGRRVWCVRGVGWSRSGCTGSIGAALGRCGGGKMRPHGRPGRRCICDARELGSQDCGEHAGERLPVVVTSPTFAAGGEIRSGACGVGVGTPHRGGEKGQLFDQPQSVAVGGCRGEGGHGCRQISASGGPGDNDRTATRVVGIPAHRPAPLRTIGTTRRPPRPSSTADDWKPLSVVAIYEMTSGCRCNVTTTSPPGPVTDLRSNLRGLFAQVTGGGPCVPASEPIDLGCRP